MTAKLLTSGQFAGAVGLLSGRPLVLVTLAYICGIVIARTWSGQAGFLIWLTLLPLLLLLTVYLFRIFDSLLCLLLAGALLAGGMSYFFAVESSPASLTHFSGSPLYVEGTIADEPVYYSDHLTFPLLADTIERANERQPVNGLLEVRIYGDDGGQYWFGERLRIRGEIVEPRGFRNPGGFDYAYYLRSKGIDALIYPRPIQVEIIGTGELNRLAESAVKTRVKLTDSIIKVLPSPSAELLTALLFGRKEALPEYVENNFRQAGAGHLMAVSGLHVGLIAGLLLGLFHRIKLPVKGSLFLVIMLVLAYAYLTGMRPSAIRAAVMVSLAVTALLFDREHDLPTALSIAALATLFFNPLLLYTAGFQLSYIATLAIVYGYRPLERLLCRFNCPGFLRVPVAVTMAAQLGVLPLTLYHFQALPAGSLFFNLALMPFIAIIIGLGLTGALIYLVLPGLGKVFLWSVEPLLALMIKITAWSNLPYLYLNVRPPGISSIVFFYLLGSVLLWFYYRPADLSSIYDRIAINISLRKKILIPLLLFISVILVWSGLIFPQQDQLTVTFLDVGQGASALIETPCGRTILIDAGGQAAYRGDPGAIGERVILPFLQHSGYSRLDLGVITHPHEDHFGGFLPLVEAIAIEQMLVMPGHDPEAHYAVLLAEAERGGTKIYEAAPGQLWQCNCGLRLEILSPPASLYRGTSSDLNNNSIVLMLHHRDYKMLFTGDIEDAAVNGLLQSDRALKADLLQVPHHGGYIESMPRFLEAVKPELAIIQVGYNSFGHPHPDIIESLNRAGVQLFRNDRNGAITIKVKGDRVTVDCMDNPPVTAE